MRARRSRAAAAALATVLSLCGEPLAAQGVEIAPFGGYRFGGDFFELLAARPVDLDGAISLGVAVDIPFTEETQFEAIFTRERATILLAAAPALSTTSTVDHWLAGGLTELGNGRVRPFLTGLVGLTRYAGETDSELRFAVSAGGGVKLFPQSHIGLRLDGRAFTTIIDANARAYTCAPNTTCLLALHADLVWQAEFTTGLVIRFR